MGRYPEFQQAIRHVQRLPQIWLAVAVLFAGVVALFENAAALAGALFGAGAVLLGGGISEWNARRAALEDQHKKERDALRFFAPELHRSIERVIYIHSRAIANFICASAENGIKPNDLKGDFLPFWPVLYPQATQFRDLGSDEASAQVAYHDSLHSLAAFVNDWWDEKGSSRSTFG